MPKISLRDGELSLEYEGRPSAETMKSPEPTDESKSSLTEYRDGLIELEQKSQEDFDKTVLALSSGGLGLSFVFLKDVIGTAPIVHAAYLMATWICWGASSLFVLLSFYMSVQALRRAIKQVDGGTIYKEDPGGMFSKLLEVFNALGAFLFVVGVFTIIIFASLNLTKKGGQDVTEKTATTATASSTATTAPQPPH